MISLNDLYTKNDLVEVSVASEVLCSRAFSVEGKIGLVITLDGVEKKLSEVF